ncbi:chromosome partitioning protein ParB [Anaerosporomusa subterranea]|jgi:ParB family chromosome partitioning protein|uniref:Chromosome partitioning protein ParB n=1 Tax=Anaerosporomusa subterranea TaxID=1794912 RepID=A0A154BP58_ANASB|nr:ParB/RepB/Spo0J family partition protein [Anaerosporomusa subterranea]KYZ75722.1 chromosome partitioning protein ParB [Anaerosporomusa subterranea]MDF2501460.1 spo0J [Anaerosporomusa subterranea]
MTAKRGLGKGLGAFFASADTVTEHDETLEVVIKLIKPNPFQPRRVFDQEALDELARSIRQYGVIQPIIVRRSPEGYDLVAGERRWRASQLAGLSVIPAVVRDYTDSEMTEIALIENLQRKDLNALEEAAAFQQLMTEFGLTQEEVARKIGRSRSMVANMLRLLNLQPEVQEYVSRGTLSMGQARPLLAVEDPAIQCEAARMIIEEDLNARDAEELVKRLCSKKEKKAKSPVSDQREFFITEMEDKFKLALGTQVRIKPGKMKSKIEIDFYNSEDLERILECLSAQQQVAATKLRGPIVV